MLSFRATFTESEVAAFPVFGWTAPAGTYSPLKSAQVPESQAIDTPPMALGSAPRENVPFFDPDPSRHDVVYELPDVTKLL